MKRITNPRLVLAIGAAALAGALIIERFLPSNPGLNFLEGFLFAISLVFNVRYLLSHFKAEKE
ncbi:MAG TPA: hypothetical protein PLG33_08345 [Prolixibacteraceae bacterium]|nr:hypothetical protein [Prolixibacteraceae bacterium]HPR86048.1 hypothetical protein [Prolixibacteraceae bacterium]